MAGYPRSISDYRKKARRFDAAVSARRADKDKITYLFFGSKLYK